MSATKNSSKKTFEAALSELLKEAQAADTYSQIETVLKKLRVLKEQVIPKKQQKKKCKRANVGQKKNQSETDIIHKCEKILSSRLRQLRIKGKSPSNKAPNRRIIKSESPPSTMKNRVLNESNDDDSEVNILNSTLQALKNDVTKEKNQRQKLKKKYERSQFQVARKDEEIEQLKQQLQLQQSKIMEKILSQPSPPVTTHTNGVVTLPINAPHLDTHQTHSIADQNNLLKEKEKIVARYEQRISKKNQIITKLKEQLVELKAELNIVRQENNLHNHSGSREKDDLRRMLDAATSKLDSSIRQKDELRRQNQQYRLKNSLYAEQIERLLSEKSAYKQTLQRNYTILKDQLIRKERQSIINLQRKNSQPQLHQPYMNNDKTFIIERVHQTQKQVQKLKEDLIEAEHRNKMLAMELNQSKDRLSELEGKYEEKKSKYSDAKKQLERIKSETLLHTILKDTTQNDQGRRNQCSQNNSKSLQKRLRTLQGIKSMIRRFPR